MSGIFISYRREDSEDSTRAIYESLRPQFGKERVFLDVEAIKPGSDFRDAIEESLADCGVCLVVIGPNWLNIRPDNDPSGPRRIDNPGDFVRMEVASALKKGKSLPVVPVLVRGATVPPADQLPDDLKELAYRNAVSLNHSDWDSNVNKLIDVMRPHVGDPRQTQQSVPARSPASAASRKGLIAGVLAAVVIVAAILFFVFRPAPGGEVTVTIMRNARLTSLPNPVDVAIDDKSIGQIRASAAGSTPLQFHTTPGQHNFKFSDAQSQSTCKGTFLVSATQTKFVPRMRDGGTACALDTGMTSQ